MPCHVFIRWLCHYLFVSAPVRGTLPFSIFIHLSLPFLLLSENFIHTKGLLTVLFVVLMCEVNNSGGKTFCLSTWNKF